MRPAVGEEDADAKVGVVKLGDSVGHNETDTGR
jgi:hypothetical protein